MKWNIEYECTENEFINWTNVLGGIINKMIDAKTFQRAAVKAANAFTEELDNEPPIPFVMEDGGLDEDSEDSFNEEPTREPIFEEPKLSPHQEQGKTELLDLLNEWVVNFDTDEQPQPDRGEIMLQLGNDGKRAGSIVSYCMVVGGLTKALWNVAYEEFTSHGYTDDFEKYMLVPDPRVDKLDPDAVRKIAGNMCQIASVHLAPLADQFEYPNPLSVLNY